MYSVHVLRGKGVGRMCRGMGGEKGRGGRGE